MFYFRNAPRRFFGAKVPSRSHSCVRADYVAMSGMKFATGGSDQTCFQKYVQEIP